MATHETSDVKAAGMLVRSREREGMPDASRRLTTTELNIRETRKWHIRSAISRRGTIGLCHGNLECVAYITAWRVDDGK
jgi:hypothetical protein